MLGALGPALGKLAGCNCGTLVSNYTVRVNFNFLSPDTITIILYQLPLFRVRVGVLTGDDTGERAILSTGAALAAREHPRRYGPVSEPKTGREGYRALAAGGIVTMRCTTGPTDLVWH